MTVAARAMRRVLRRKRSIIWAIFGWTVFFINALLLIPFDGEPFALDVRTVTSLLVEVMLLSVLLFQDRFNGMIARKNALAGTKEYHVAFGEDSYTVVTAATTSTFRYELIDALAESQDYIIVPFPVSWTVKMKKKQKETQDILSYHSQAAGCSDKARAKASGGRQPIEECGRTGL